MGVFDLEVARAAAVGPYVGTVSGEGLDHATVERFIAGLRAAPLEQFPDEAPFGIDDVAG